MLTGRAKKLVTKRYVEKDISVDGVSVETVEDYIYDSKGALTGYKPAIRQRATLAWQNGNMTSFAYSIPSNTDIERENIRPSPIVPILTSTFFRRSWDY